MDAALKELVNSGALGAVVAIVLLFLLWAGKKMLAAFIEQTKELSGAIKELTASQVAIRDNCRACRSDSVAAVRDSQRALETHIEHVAWRVHDQAFGENKEMIGSAVTTLAREITGAIGRLSTDEKERRLKEQVEELSRPHAMTPAPAGGGIVQR